jgi:hypothetical protein
LVPTSRNDNSHLVFGSAVTRDRYANVGGFELSIAFGFVLRLREQTQIEYSVLDTNLGAADRVDLVERKRHKQRRCIRGNREHLGRLARFGVQVTLHQWRLSFGAVEPGRNVAAVEALFCDGHSILCVAQQGLLVVANFSFKLAWHANVVSNGVCF